MQPLRGIEATPQILRNTFAMNLWQVERDLVGLAEMMGLESVESAKIYAQMGTASETPDTKQVSAKS